MILEYSRTEESFSITQFFEPAPGRKISRYVNFDVRENPYWNLYDNNSPQLLFSIVFAHCTLDWRHIRKYSVTESEWFDTFLKAVDKFGISPGLFMAALPLKANSSKYIAQFCKTVYLPNMELPLGEKRIWQKQEAYQNS